MKVLVVGSGGREHALVWKLRRSPTVKEILCAPGNPGTARLARNVAIQPGAILELAAFAEQNRCDLTVVGPELPLSLGIADEFHRRGLPIFGARKAAARLETSKVFAKEFMVRHRIPTAAFTVHRDPGEARRAIEARGEFPVVIKADGLAAGKGVTVAGSREEALAAIAQTMEEKRFGAAGARILIEEFLRGKEVSFFGLTDGARVLPLATCRDYKAARDGDRGPNTGGMGTYSPSIHLTEEVSGEIVEKILEPTIAGLAREGCPYRGVLYAGIMLTEEGPMVLEFNARFGDPETQALLPRMKSDLLPLLLSCAGGTVQGAEVEWNPDAAVCVVLASEGYPENPRTGFPIRGIDAERGPGEALILHAGTRHGPGGEILTAGGRVLNVIGSGEDLARARERAYQCTKQISFPGIQFRTDIALETIPDSGSAGRRSNRRKHATEPA